MPCVNGGDDDDSGNSMIATNRRAPDTMRHGGFKFEVVGSDRATDGTREAPTRFQGVRPLPNPLTNQSGMLAPHTSADGQALKAAAGTVFIREMDPILFGKKFGNNAGRNTSRSAQNNTIVPADFGYDGILPLTQQPIINKPLPY